MSYSTMYICIRWAAVDALQMEGGWEGDWCRSWPKFWTWSPVLQRTGQLWRQHKYKPTNSNSRQPLDEFVTQLTLHTCWLHEGGTVVYLIVLLVPHAWLHAGADPGFWARGVQNFARAQNSGFSLIIHNYVTTLPLASCQQVAESLLRRFVAMSIDSCKAVWEITRLIVFGGRGVNAQNLRICK